MCEWRWVCLYTRQSVCGCGYVQVSGGSLVADVCVSVCARVCVCVLAQGGLDQTFQFVWSVGDIQQLSSRSTSGFDPLTH